MEVIEETNDPDDILPCDWCGTPLAPKDRFMIIRRNVPECFRDQRLGLYVMCKCNCKRKPES